MSSIVDVNVGPKSMSKGLFAFILSAMTAALVAAMVLNVEWDGLLTSQEPKPLNATVAPAEFEKIIKDWPVVMAEVDEAVSGYRNVGGSYSGETAIRRGVQANTFKRLGWQNGRGEFLTGYLFMLRNSILKYSEQHRALGYFMEHYEQNQAVSSELKAWQINQIDMLLQKIDEAPDLDAYPSGDVELMVRYFDEFHAMLIGYGRPQGFAEAMQARR